MANRVSVFCRSKKYYPFIMKVNSGADSQITIPTFGTGYNYDLRVQGGQSWYGLIGNHTINFPSANTDYFIEIRGIFPMIYIYNNSERDKFLDIQQWGGIIMGSTQQRAFEGAIDMTCTATDTPRMELVTIGTSMFRDAASFNPSSFNPTLENLTNSDFMFDSCTDFNPSDFSPTLVSLEKGNRMFFNCPKFNPPNFAPDLENLTDGRNMFQQATAFNPLNFAPTLVNLINGSYMFSQAIAFNPPNFAPTLANLVRADGMFYGTTNFSQEIYAPNTTMLQNDIAMFRDSGVKKITLNNTALTTTRFDTFQCPLLTDLILIDRKVDLTISYSPLLVGAKIDALFTSLGTANSGASITITTAQNTSGIDTTIATLKGWTIIVV